MMRALAVAVLLAFALPAGASQSVDGTVVAQDQQKQSAPKRDCERTKKEEGVS